MCESSVWVRYPDGHTEKIADDVLIVTQDDDTVVLQWFLKEPRRVPGRIREVDAVRHVITLNVTGALSLNTEEAETPTAPLKAGEDHVHPHPHSHPHSHG